MGGVPVREAEQQGDDYMVMQEEGMSGSHTDRGSGRIPLDPLT